MNNESSRAHTSQLDADTSSGSEAQMPVVSSHSEGATVDIAPPQDSHCKRKNVSNKAKRLRQKFRPSAVSLSQVLVRTHIEKSILCIKYDDDMKVEKLCLIMLLHLMAEKHFYYTDIYLSYSR